jgi:outer membrane PBP1 activator LpoA protein
MIEDSRHANEDKTWFAESLDKIVVQISAGEDKTDNDMDAQGFLNMFTYVNDMNNSDDDLGGGFNQKSKKIPTFASITDLVQMKGDFVFVKKGNESNLLCSVV